MEDKFINWENKYNTGHSKIDEQHKKLVNILNDLYRGIAISKTDDEDIVFRSAIKRLIDYVGYHFSYEETIMERCEYAGIEEHKDWHRKFVAMILEEAELYKREPRLIGSRLIRKLRDWILEHIGVRDKDMVSIILKSKKNKF